ncbi:MAG TPA: Calx-beta domain-containing protein, partial [Candidatus Paceibacterota bacterium]|nr:Calx-beta domain-containing protein [Verrucomicrobiota bacterium]HRZ46713.1 Calx-beta domain-containing protein [Candidatus Paceibacterota bacterium]
PSTNTFTVRVTDNGSPAATASTSFTVIVFEDDEPPSIITQPASLAVNEGDPATFSVAAAGSEPFVYQWRINGTNIPGANEASLVLAETVLSDAGNYTVFISNEVGDATSEIAVLTINPAALLSGRGLDGYIAGGTVFFDANLNGKLDEGEPSTTTDPAGRFDLKVVVARFDANQNGGLDLEEGQLVLQGGVDISTGLPLEMPLSAPPGANVITPLTALLNELARRDESLPLAEAETQLEEALGLPPEVQLLEFDPLAAAVANDTAAAPVLQAAAKVQDTVVQIAALLDQSTPDASPADLAREVIAQIASAVQTNPTVNLSDTQLVGTVIQETASAMQATVDPAVQQGAAQVIAAINQAKDQLVAEAEGALAAAAAISQVQWIAQGQAAEQLKQAGSGTLVIDEVVAAQTCHALNQAIAQAPVGNLTGTEQPPGIVAFSHDSFSVLENGVAVQEVTITRHQGNEGAVRLQIALSDGTARLADGDYGATSIDVVLSDHELSRTVSLAGIIQDDDLAEGAETLSLTLSFSPDDSSGASLGTITAATLQIVDNDAVGTFAFTEAEHAIFEDSICCKAITITRSGGASGEVELLVTPLPVDGGATPNVDYHAQPISVLFSDGNQLRLITVPILSDGKFEPDEPMDLQLDLADGAPAGAAIGSIRTARVVILNDDPEPPRVGFARTDGAQFDFTVHGQAGYHCRIEGSEDLVNWVAVQDLELNAAIQSVPLPIPPNTGQRFYRAVVWK